MNKQLPVTFQRLENVAIAIVVTIAFVHLGFAWWWLVVLFMLFDVSMVGYALNKQLGAVTYNVGHSYIGPALLAGIYFVVGGEAWVFVALTWAFHIAVDRALGYGLKEPAGFQHTHLGVIGKK